MKSKIELYKQHHASGHFVGDSLRPHASAIKQIIQNTKSKVKSTKSAKKTISDFEKKYRRKK